ncbi:ABC transporter substrate-binding protein [Paracoccus sp. pheM1]|uniref:ABC transporter substrate-binding protein n=1 Tax=Paracoccus sp. pheM1 TaxID=2831675 RepID=UPI001BDB6D06|nr:ABC transporter substrate-binding protein [Paracoccus sp. pheM1]MBT0782310.1 ABC transporter substrate-binding protein [Paracoccus sp. pheM1]
MKHPHSTTALALIFGLVVSASAAQEVSVVTWGGAIEVSQIEAYNKPFTEATGIKVTTISADDPSVLLRAQVGAGNVTADVFDVAMADAVRLCDDGAVIAIEPADLPPGADGTPAAEDFIDGALSDCGIATIFAGTVISYDTSKFPDKAPSTVADFFDTQAFPGKRGLAKDVKRTLHFALMADGVPASEVYDVLATPEGVDRAFAKLDTIKKDVVWWEAGAQPPQLLADGEVTMTTAYNGRIFDAAINEGKPFEVIWDGQYLELNAFVIPVGAPHPEEALEYVKFATGSEPLAGQARYISYGPARKSSAPLLGLYKDDKTEMAPNLPTAPENMANAVLEDPGFWADHSAELAERFNNWLAAK